jgi:hypothetical protein
MEPFEKIPLWLELSGLPKAMNEAARTPSAWPVFCKIVALDCRRNPSTPAPVAISIRGLAEACGISPAAAQRAAQSLRNKGWIACFLPDNEIEEALFQVKTPLPSPLTPDQVRQAHPSLFPDPTTPLRYETAHPGETEEDKPDDPVLHEIIDLYFNTISMKMNNFILDELRLVRKRFEMPLIRRIFFRAREHGLSSMGWVLKELHRETARRMKEELEQAEKKSET